MTEMLLRAGKALRIDVAICDMCHGTRHPDVESGAHFDVKHATRHVHDDVTVAKTEPDCDTRRSAR